jgi:hypothetical protein
MQVGFHIFLANYFQMPQSTGHSEAPLAERQSATPNRKIKKPSEKSLKISPDVV